MSHKIHDTLLLLISLPIIDRFLQFFHSLQYRCLFSFSKMFVCYYHYTLIFQLHSQGSAETHLQYGGIHSNRIIANFLQSVPAKVLKIGRQLAKR